MFQRPTKPTHSRKELAGPRPSVVPAVIAVAGALGLFLILSRLLG
jgi:hypothetical protein